MDNNDNKLTWSPRLVRQGRSLAALFPIMATVFIAFLVIGIAMPVLPLHVHHGLELSTFIVGLVAGSQFAAAIASRLWAGRYADASGACRHRRPDNRSRGRASLFSIATLPRHAGDL